MGVPLKVIPIGLIALLWAGCQDESLARFKVPTMMETSSLHLAGDSLWFIDPASGNVYVSFSRDRIVVAVAYADSHPVLRPKALISRGDTILAWQPVVERLTPLNQIAPYVEIAHTTGRDGFVRGYWIVEGERAVWSEWPGPVGGPDSIFISRYIVDTLPPRRVVAVPHDLFTKRRVEGGRYLRSAGWSRALAVPGGYIVVTDEGSVRRFDESGLVIGERISLARLDSVSDAAIVSQGSQVAVARLLRDGIGWQVHWSYFSLSATTVDSVAVERFPESRNPELIADHGQVRLVERDGEAMLVRAIGPQE